ncbi:hypothetical protein M6B38_325180 [Iris pallida]|uniref:Uncharacterized protein n=1 Tax=Iris pallida TaxID=29817 RepID=A0AAX6H7C4_IRIPA|nr:hypothetical protein M6B38_325180 [Iris pallida]
MSSHRRGRTITSVDVFPSTWQGIPIVGS